jgi:Ni/Fe-hydrogenase subunit HybB-like protein
VELQQHVVRKMRGTFAPFGRAGRIWLGALIVTSLAGLSAYCYQLVFGLRVTGMREYVSWGVYMTNFVFFIGVSHAGTLISAILRVTNADWRRSITRMAEAITVFALIVGAPQVIIDMGRPDRILNVIIHGRLNSPILWDVCSIATYICGSLLYLYVAMIPDLGILASSSAGQPTLRSRIYKFLSLGYRGAPEQRRYLERALATMAVIIIPVAISVHTVVSWIFGMTLRPGWHSTIFGPYFVIGAIFSGTAAIITAMAVFRKVYGLEEYLTYRHFRNLAALLFALNLLYIYFTLSEYLTVWYTSESTDKRLIDTLMGGFGSYGLMFWSFVVLGLFVPAVLLAIPAKKSIVPIVVAAVLINIGMWIKRYLIIIPTLLTTFIPAAAAGATPRYFPTWVEWTVSAGALAFFLLLFTLFAKWFPIISIWETVEGVEELGAERIGVEIKSVPTTGARGPVLATAVCVIAAVFFVSGNSAVAQEIPKPQPKIAISSSVEEGKKMIVATVMLDGKPLSGARVGFFVQRRFGLMTLGAEETIDDGTAAVTFPEGLPGEEGKLQIVAQIQTPAEYASVQTQGSFDGGTPIRAQTNLFPRALWSPHAPFALVFSIVSLLTIVWGTYVFVISQLIQIRKGAKT